MAGINAALNAAMNTGITGAPAPKPKPRNWVDTEPLWKDRLGDGWKGMKVLGQGGQGIVGHWKYQGNGPIPEVTDVAVKQDPYTSKRGTVFARRGFLDEVGFMQRFSEVETPHVVKMYKQLFEDMGRTGIPQDMHGFSVHRMYLEFCPGGDLFGLFQMYKKAGTQVPEDVLWPLFHCLARGVMVMDRGNEDIAGPRTWHRKDGEIAHLDLKLENILIGAPSVPSDREHGDNAPYKIADFGLARLMNTTQSLDDIADTGGTRVHNLPEQTTTNGNRRPMNRPWNQKGMIMSSSDVKTVRLGAASNVWHIGWIMLLMTAQLDPYDKDWDNNPPMFATHVSKRTRYFTGSGLTVSTPGFIAGKLPYSEQLHTLIECCLHVDPPNRIHPEELVKMTRKYWEVYGRAQGGGLAARNQLPVYQEPQLSDVWYSGLKRRPPPAPPAAKVVKKQRTEPQVVAAIAQAVADPLPSAPPPTISSIQRLGGRNPNIVDGAYVLITFVCPIGEWSNFSGTVEVRNDIRVNEFVQMAKQTLGYRDDVKILSKEIMFRAGVNGPVMGGGQRMRDFVALDKDGTIEVNRVVGGKLVNPPPKKESSGWTFLNL